MSPSAQARSSSTLPTILRGHQINPIKPPSTYRLLYLNTNGLSSSRPYNKTATIITTAHQFDPDAILCTEVEAFMGNITIRKGNEQIFKQVGNGGSLLCGYNTYHLSTSSPRAYPTRLAGGVCQWFGPRAINRLAHTPPDLLGRFVISTILGPRNQAISIITAYRPVKIGSGVNPVFQQHKRVLGPTSDPRRQLLLDLTTEIINLRRKGNEIVLAIDANEELPQQQNIIWTDLEKFVVNTGLVDAMTSLHGYATIPSCSRSSDTSSPIDFILCSPSLLRCIRISMLDELSGCPSDHQTFIMDVDTAALWKKHLPPTPPRTPRGFTSSNKPRTRAFINKLSTLLDEANFQQALQAAQDALTQKSPDEELQSKMERADSIMTNCMLEAQQAVLPSQRARSHPWSPALIQAQRKKGLTANLLSILSHGRQITPRIERRFRRNATAIDPTWEIPQLSPHSIRNMAHDTNKYAKKQLHLAAELRNKHLEERRMKMAEAATSAGREEALKTIIKKERTKMKHRAIQNRLRTRNAPLTFVVDTDGTRRTDSDMINSILSYNATHFAQARTNGASAAQQTPFADSLKSFRTPQKEVLQNMDDIINGKLDTSLIQDFEIPFYRAFHRVAPPIKKLGSPSYFFMHSSTLPRCGRIQSRELPRGDTWVCIKPCVPPLMTRLPWSSKNRS